MLCIPTDRRLPKLRLRSRQLHRLLGQVGGGGARPGTGACLTLPPTSPFRLLASRPNQLPLNCCAAPGAAPGRLGPGQPLPARPPGAGAGAHQLPQVTRELIPLLQAVGGVQEVQGGWWDDLARPQMAGSRIGCRFCAPRVAFPSRLAYPCLSPARRSETDGVLVSSGVHWQPFRCGMCVHATV